MPDSLPDDLPDGFILQEQADPAELMIGPFYKHREKPLSLFKPEQRHSNLMEIVHGGVLMTFADFTLCAGATTVTGDADCVTVNLNCNFLAGAMLDHWLAGEARITRTTHRLVFVDGTLSNEGEPVVTFSGIGKRIRKES